MSDMTPWNDIVRAAWAEAQAGRQTEAVESLIARVGPSPADPELSVILHMSAVHGQHARALPLAEAYLTRQAPVRANRHCNVWALEILRKAGRFEDFVAHTLAFAPDQISIPLFYVMLAGALHDETFLRTFETDPRLETLFAMMVEQAHASGHQVRSEFIFKNAFTFTSAPQLYSAVFPIHRRLMLAVDGQLSDSKNVFLARLQLGLGEGIDGAALVRALVDVTPQELCAVWTIRKERMAELMRPFYIEGSFNTAARDLAPHVVLTFEKIFSGLPDTALRLIVRDWVDHIPRRYADTAPADLPTDVLDQLVLIHRGRRPDIHDWYMARRPDAEALGHLRLFNPGVTFPAPALSLTRKPRVGVCISGQLRGYTQAHPTVMRHLLGDVEPVIFVDTWRKIGRKTPTPAQAWRMFSGAFLKTYQSTADAMGFQAMQARYPALTALDDASTVDVETLAAFYGCPPDHIRIEDDETGVFTGYSNPRKMYHKIRGAQAMLEASGIEVDAALRIRPDKSLDGVTPAFDWHQLIDASHNDRVFFADFPARTHPTSGFVIGDQAGIATMELMHIYTQAEDTTVEAGKLGWSDWPATPRAHANLSHALWINSVRIDTMPVRWGKMFDPEALTAQAVLGLLELDMADRTPDVTDAQLLAAAQADIKNAG
ncbi:hypothetical protein [uncultured Tateyamaria sp.]|uniref:hypothetical protein n=1 Tax=Tateyamaria sp. 1078 TaxID=3417464 RepID=UPI00261FB2E2|nr:hypothetical protein [uncultured Tateyamaria sp.]